MKVILAEKPSVAKNIADALHIKEKKDGYFEGNGYYVTWAFGHLLELYDAKDYDEKMTFWRMENFPFIPDNFQYKVKYDRQKKKIDPGAKKQLQCIKTLINKKEVEGVISATDYDREGQIIGDVIFNYLKVKKPIERMLLNEWTEDEVKKGLSKLVSNQAMKPLQDAGISRQHADWLIGINLTSVATLKYKKQKGEVFNIGRVLLPTLKMIYDRDQAIDNFKPEPYFKLTATFQHENIVYEGTYTLDKKDRFETEAQLLQLKDQLQGKQGALIKKDVVEKKEYPYPLFNLSALQGQITSQYTGFTSDKVLKVAQSLYEKKYITYPRTASNVLDESLVDKAKKVLETLKKGHPCEQELRFKISSRVFNSKKVESHSAIIPTYVIPKNLGQEEALVYTAIKNRFLSQFMPHAISEETTLFTQVDPFEGIFVSKGKVQKQQGFKKIEADNSKDTVLPDVNEGLIVKVADAKVTTHATTPPKAYTEKTLLRAMETCGKHVKDDAEETLSMKDSEQSALMEAVLKGFSIGTPATRAETIKKLCTTGYTMMQKKNIRCTPKGKQLIETLPIKELMDLDYTGKLEKTLADIEKSAVSKEIFMNHIIRFVVKGVSEIKGQSVPTEWKKNTKSTEKEVLGSCPLCGQDVIEGERGFGCMGYKSGCHFVIWKADEKLAFYHKKATKTMVKSLLKKGEATVKGFKTPKGTKFDAKVKYAYHNDQKMGEWFFEKV